MKNRKREICTSGSVRDEAGQPPHLLGLWKTCWAFWSRNGAFVPGDRRFDRLLAMACVLTKLSTSSQLQAPKKTFVCATKSS
jgi:hypothetical protein